MVAESCIFMCWSGRRGGAARLSGAGKYDGKLASKGLICFRRTFRRSSKRGRTPKRKAWQSLMQLLEHAGFERISAKICARNGTLRKALWWQDVLCESALATCFTAQNVLQGLLGGGGRTLSRFPQKRGIYAGKREAFRNGETRAPPDAQVQREFFFRRWRDKSFADNGGVAGAPVGCRR